MTCISTTSSPGPTLNAAVRRRQRGARGLPAVMREGLVGLRHAEDVVLPLERAALLGLRVEELVGEPLGHRLLAALAGRGGGAPGCGAAGPSSSRGAGGRTPRASGRRACAHGAAAPRRAPGRS